MALNFKRLLRQRQKFTCLLAPPTWPELQVGGCTNEQRIMMEKITSIKDLIRVDRDYKDSSRSSASVCYGGLAGMLVATVKWAGISIRKDQTAYALEILERAIAERRKVDDVVERYNRRFNAEHKEV